MLWHLGPHQPPNGVSGSEPRFEAREGGRLRYWNVKDNDRKGHVGRVARGQHAEVLPRSWVRLFGIDDGKAFDRVFSVGDEAAYGGYNLTYTGQIVAIGLKTVTLNDPQLRVLLAGASLTVQRLFLSGHRGACRWTHASPQHTGG